ncbi:hypothetical protein QO034_13995 [Sedimentitalea sp. JM2-8]|uniref:UrcA family protein n=1 Tax=Sedimentitalea xiamensis TaxID=3050037 RepID=A0ABT7FGH3_9RHOB|nr:hypothetical protein [Sedimentitalea xiamensis]MDK3074226.1 hypothetical protein [Sedimentitalea xiamensis]
MKINSHSFSTALAIAATALAGSPAVAQGVGPGVLYTVILPAGEFGSQNYTDVLTGNIAAAQKFCAELGNDSYTVDCLSERLEKIADDIPRDSDYAEVKTILKNTSDQLADLARANRDPAQTRGRATRAGENPVTTTRPLTPVRPEAVPQVNAQAQAILDNTQTLLLRSAEGSESKALQYSRIADALGSSKVLLRSA